MIVQSGSSDRIFVSCSRAEIEAYNPFYDTDWPHLIIRIRSPGEERAKVVRLPTTVGVQHLAFHDLEEAVTDFYTLFDGGFAASIVRFVTQHEPRWTGCLVHCAAGASRSTAVAAALAKAYGVDDQPWFQQTTPNMLVYRTLLEAARRYGGVNE